MCGIVGYIGSKNASPILMEGLERLSYRGYDSAGVAVIGPDGKIGVRKAKGRLENLAGLLKESPVSGTIGIGHTRWATHGEPSDLNAHPHTDVKGGIAVVHNGIIENHAALRRHLEQTGAKFVSQTDTEVIAHLLNWLYDGDMKRTLIRAMGMLEGSYALGILCDHEPGDLYCARNDSPLVVGARDGEGFIASDIPALLSHTRDVIFLQDKEIAVLQDMRRTYPNDEQAFVLEQLGEAYYTKSGIVSEESGDETDNKADLLRKESISCFNELISLGYGRASTYLNIAIVSQRRADYEGAEKALLQMIDRYPNNSDAYVQMAFLTIEREGAKPQSRRNYSTIKDYYKKAVELGASGEKLQRLEGVMADLKSAGWIR